MALKQHLTQKLDQRLSPQQIQLMKLLEVPAMELDQRIKQEIEENPALEEGADKDEFEREEEIDDHEDDDLDFSKYLSDEPDYKTRANNYSKDDEQKVIPYSGSTTFQERLSKQLFMLDLEDDDYVIADTIIGNLDESGYLNREIDAIVDDLAFAQNISVTEEQVERVLSKIQQMEPAGIGARDLKECLMIQINRKQDGNISRFTAKKILEDFYEEFTRKHYDKICKEMEIEEEDLKDALDEIIRLNPKPGGSMSESSGNYQSIIPDFIVLEHEGELTLSMNGRNAPQLKVSRQYETMLRNYIEGASSSKSEKEALTFVKQKLESAKNFIDAIKKRQSTMEDTMRVIMEYQREYFLTGDEGSLKPMILKDIAEKVGLDVSTISRVSNSKYVQTNYGVFALKHFFSESMSKDTGEEVSTREVQRLVKEFVDAENKRKPLTDEKLMFMLKEKGFTLARRTVAKYREYLNIPVARLRKEL